MSSAPESPPNSDEAIKHRLEQEYLGRLMPVLIPVSCEATLIQAMHIMGIAMKPVFPVLHEEIMEWCSENIVDCPFVDRDGRSNRYFLLFAVGAEKDAIFFKLRWFN